MKKRWPQAHSSEASPSAEDPARAAGCPRPGPFRLLAGLLSVATTFVAPCAYADCNGFLNRSEQGYKLEGTRLEPSGPKVAAGTELEFNGIAKVEDRFFLTRARSDVMFDSENVELTAGCDLPTRPAPQAR